MMRHEHHADWREGENWEEYEKKSPGNKKHDHEKMMKYGGSMNIMDMISMKKSKPQ